MSGTESFYLYSCSKPITCTDVLQLYEQGKILLTDPVSNYIPEYQNMKILSHKGNGESVLMPAKNTITIAHLLTMTSGMDYNLSSPTIVNIQNQTKGRAPTQDIIRALASQPLCYEPGTRWQYSLSHDVLGAIVEIISGQQFGAYLR